MFELAVIFVLDDLTRDLIFKAIYFLCIQYRTMRQIY